MLMVPLGGGLGGGGLGGGGFAGGGFGESNWGGNWGGNGGPPNWSWAPTRWQTGKKKKKPQPKLEYDEDDDDEDEESSEPRGAREKRRQRKIYQRRVDKEIKTRMLSCTFYIVQSND